MKEKQDIRRFEIGMVQLIVVAFVAWGVSKIPYSEIGKSSIVLLAVIHMLTYYLSNYHNNLSIEDIYKNLWQHLNIVCYLY